MCNEGMATRSDSVEKIKILHVINTLSIGGAEYYVVNLTNALDRAQFESFIVYCEGETLGVEGGALVKKLKAEQQTFKIRLRKMRDWWDFSALIYNVQAVLVVRKIIKTQNIDLVHTHLMPSALFAWIAAGSLRVPTIYNLMRVFIPLDRFDWIGVRIPVVGSVYKALVTQYVAFSQYAYDDLLTKLKVEAKRLQKIYLGIDLERHQPITHDESLDHRETRFKQPVVGVIARLAPGKGVHKAMLAWPFVLQKVPNAKLLIVGDGPLRDELELLRLALNVADSIVFAGFVGDTAQVLQEIDLFLQVSDAPNIGLATLEAMASGKPIVTVVKDNEEKLMAIETLVDGKNGFIVDNIPEKIADSIVMLLTDRCLATKMGKFSRHIVEEKFDFKKHVVEVEKMYVRLLMESRLERK